MLKFNGKKLFTKEGELLLPYSILEAIEIDNVIIVIYDYMEFSNKKAAKNLVGLNTEGEQLWVARNPTGYPGDSTDAYTGFCEGHKVSKGSIGVCNYTGIFCEIGVSNGVIRNKVITK